MYFDNIIQRILDNPYSAFFYTPSYYTKSNSFIFTNPKEIIPIYNKNDLNNSLQLVDCYLDKGLRGYCLIEYEAGYLMEEKLENLLPEEDRRLLQFFFFEEKDISKIKSSRIDFGEIDPNSFSVDVAELEIGHSIHVNVLEAEEGITILHDDEETIVTILAPKVEEVVVEEEEIEGEEGAEEGAEDAAPEEAKDEGSEESS